MKGARQTVEVEVAGLTIDPYTNMPIVVLKDLAGKYQLPIWIGLVEASAIATQLEKIELARPMTHDLMRQLMEAVGATLDRVEVTELKNDTFFASLYFESKGKAVVLDARPSDAIALALRTGAKIYVSQDVLETARQAEKAAEVPGSGEERPVLEKAGPGAALAGQPPSKWAEILASLSPEDFGKFKM
jgi:bifunctional DNase/RNase